MDTSLDPADLPLQPLIPKSSDRTWCIYTTILSKEPVGRLHGLINVVDFAATEKAAKERIKELYDQNPKLVTIQQFFKIAQTGYFHKLLSGGGEISDIYDTEAKEMMVGDVKAKEDKAAKIQAELERKRATVENHEDVLDTSEDTYEVYKNFKMRQHALKQYLGYTEKTFKESQNRLKEVEKRLSSMEQSHGNWSRMLESGK